MLLGGAKCPSDSKLLNWDAGKKEGVAGRAPPNPPTLERGKYQVRVGRMALQGHVQARELQVQEKIHIGERGTTALGQRTIRRTMEMIHRTPT